MVDCIEILTCFSFCVTSFERFEQRYLLSNASDALLGSPFRPDTLFSHTLLECHRGQGVATRRFRSGGVVVDKTNRGGSGGSGGSGDGGGSMNDKTISNRIFTIEFDDFVDGSVRKVLIDHVLVSPHLRKFLEKSDVAHER